VIGFGFLPNDSQFHAFSWTEAGGLRRLEAPGGVGSVASTLNNSGQVVGTVTLADGRLRAFLWTEAGGMVDLGPLPGFDESAATHLNDRGEIVGTSSSSFPVGSRATLWRGNTARATDVFLHRSGSSGERPSRGAGTDAACVGGAGTLIAAGEGGTQEFVSTRGRDAE
jgi:probable HAF family extracellular repeat protein